MERFASRKFIVTLAFGLLVACRDWLKIAITDDALMTLAGVVATYLVGQTVLDSKEKANG